MIPRNSSWGLSRCETPTRIGPDSSLHCPCIFFSTGGIQLKRTEIVFHQCWWSQRSSWVRVELWLCNDQRVGIAGFLVYSFHFTMKPSYCPQHGVVKNVALLVFYLNMPLELHAPQRVHAWIKWFSTWNSRIMGYSQIG